MLFRLIFTPKVHAVRDREGTTLCLLISDVCVFAMLARNTIWHVVLDLQQFCFVYQTAFCCSWYAVSKITLCGAISVHCRLSPYVGSIELTTAGSGTEVIYFPLRIQRKMWMPTIISSRFIPGDITKQEILFMTSNMESALINWKEVTWPMCGAVIAN